MTQQKQVFFPLAGGLDMVTPAISKPPGRAIAVLNYEPVATGYRRLRGFERFDGHIAPSAAAISKISFTSGNTTMQALVAGDAITVSGQDSLAFLVTTPVLSSGSYGAGTAVGHIFVAMSFDQSDFVNGAALRKVSPSTSIGTQSGALDTDPNLTGYSESALLALARGYLRNEIAVVPGSGPVRCVFEWEGDIYAIRDNTPGTAAIIFKAAGNAELDGWDTVIFGYSASFDQGGLDGIELVEGSAYDDTSGAGGTAITIARVITTGGSWAAGTATGYFVTSGVGGDPSSTWAIGEYLYPNTGSTTLRACRVASTPALASLPAGGEYQFITNNFFGASDLRRTYFVNGVGRAFEISDLGGSPLASPIITGMTTDTPNAIAEHRGSLFLAFPGGSLQFSAVGEPMQFDPVVGAGEIGLGSEITNLLSASEGSLAILGEEKIAVLHGNDSSDYLLETLNDQAGALAHSAQRFGQVIYMDNQGIRTLSAAAFGNFKAGTISQLIAPLLEDYRRDGVSPVASFIRRTADQYWLIFSNGTAIIIWLGGKHPAILVANLGITVSCASSLEIDGEERVFLGASDGYVYELDKGTSFDGAEIEHYIALAYNHFGSPQQLKRIHKAILEIVTSGTTTLGLAARVDHGSEEGVSEQQTSFSVGGEAVDDFGSNELYYASQIESTGEVYIDIVCNDISLKIGGSTDDEEPHTITGITVNISPRGMKR